jgi:hypothetical protein
MSIENPNVGPNTRRAIQGSDPSDFFGHMIFMSFLAEDMFAIDFDRGGKMSILEPDAINAQRPHFIPVSSSGLERIQEMLNDEGLLVYVPVDDSTVQGIVQKAREFIARRR